ncbi:MAG: TetR/AcrR family transcriptional regulator [Gemmatimonadota bacterium]|nr:TetR/AcrR family transcriptional regulator [Gemmatimonadota bacterium]MDH5758784.1 TetR/AcrR family transcriptional regulator [Gemmatimonadota bacterium]
MSEQREHILACACDLYLRDGLDGFSMRQLARDVGVTAPALYRHYEGKEDVLVDVIREAYRRFTQYLYAALEGRTPEDRFIRAGEGYLRFALEHTRLFQILFVPPEQLGMSSLPEDLEAQACAVHQFWIDRVRECMDGGILREGDPVQVSITLWGHAHGLLSLFFHGHFRMDQDEFVALFRGSVQMVIRGLARPEWGEELTLCGTA